MPTYTATHIKSLSTTTPDGATESPNILDDAIREIKTAIANDVPCNYVVKAAAYTTVATDHVINVDTSGGAVTITLISAASANITAGKEYVIRKGTSDANAVTIDPAGSETIGGSSTATLHAQQDCIRIISDGANWMVAGFTGAKYGSSYGTSLVTITPASTWMYSGARITLPSSGIWKVTGFATVSCPYVTPWTEIRIKLVNSTSGVDVPNTEATVIRTIDAGTVKASATVSAFVVTTVSTNIDLYAYAINTAASLLVGDGSTTGGNFGVLYERVSGWV